MTRELILNRAQCLLCNEILISHHSHDFKSCKCGNLSVDGGSDYIRRLGQELLRCSEMSVYSDEPFEVLREHIYRGSLGKDGKGKLKWVKLSEISNDYLTALLGYCEDLKQTKQKWYKYYAEELNYRVINSIFIED